MPTPPLSYTAETAHAERYKSFLLLAQAVFPSPLNSPERLLFSFSQHLSPSRISVYLSVCLCTCILDAVRVCLTGVSCWPLHRNALVGTPLDLRPRASSSPPSPSSRSSSSSFASSSSRPAERSSFTAKSRLGAAPSYPASSPLPLRKKFRLCGVGAVRRLSSSLAMLSTLPRQYYQYLSKPPVFGLSFSTLFFFRASVDLFLYLSQVGLSYQDSEEYFPESS